MFSAFNFEPRLPGFVLRWNQVTGVIDTQHSTAAKVLDSGPHCLGLYLAPATDEQCALGKLLCLSFLICKTGMISAVLTRVSDVIYVNAYNSAWHKLSAVLTTSFPPTPLLNGKRRGRSLGSSSVLPRPLTHPWAPPLYITLIASKLPSPPPNNSPFPLLVESYCWLS